MKKAQGLSLNTIIIAVVVLIVLIVLWAIFTGRLSLFTGGLKSQDTDCKSVCTAAGYSIGDTKTKATCESYSDQNMMKQWVENNQEYVCCCRHSNYQNVPPGFNVA